MRKAYSWQLTKAVAEFLDHDGWSYNFDEERGAFDFGLEVEGRIREIDYYIDVYEDAILFYGFLPVEADESDQEMMEQMSKFVCLANYGLQNGSFEFDFRDGEVRYKSFMDCDHWMPYREMIESRLYEIARMLGRYAPGILGIVLDGMGAEEAFNKCGQS